MRFCAGILAWLVACECPALAQLQNYPSKPIRVIASSAAGGLSDTFMRVLGDELRARRVLDQSGLKMQ